MQRICLHVIYFKNKGINPITNELTQFFEISTGRLSAIEADFLPHTTYLKKVFRRDKSLSINEAFVLYLVARLFNSRQVAELGVRYGISTRFWLETLPECRLDGYDVKKLFNARKKRLKPIENPNFKFIRGDLHKTWQNKPYDLIFYDVHPYKLTRQIAVASKKDTDIHCFHDVGKKCYKPESSQIPPKKRTEFAEAGHWERHIMYEVFTAKTKTQSLVIGEEWRSLIMDDNYGLGVVIRNSLIEDIK